MREKRVQISVLKQPHSTIPTQSHSVTIPRLPKVHSVRNLKMAVTYTEPWQLHSLSQSRDRFG